jgi:hypothetical protein
MRSTMLSGELAFLADRLDLLAEVAALEVDLVVFECRHGLVPELADELVDLRRRLELVRANVLAQVAGVPWRAWCESPRVVH